MSHAATNWAIRQRGLKPAAKIVLWHLADCHHPEGGCFPSQGYLAHECEMSRASINAHLSGLEKAGLIKRIRSIDPRTRRQLPTRYVLEFEADDAGKAFQNVSKKAVSGKQTRTKKAAKKRLKSENSVSENKTRAVSRNEGEPCPDLARFRVQNLDTNLVKEPVINPRVREAADRSSEFEADRGPDANGKPERKRCSPEAAQEILEAMGMTGAAVEAIRRNPRARSFREASVAPVESAGSLLRNGRG